jgi:hypothetical protein
MSPDLLFLLGFPGGIGLCIAGCAWLHRRLNRKQNAPEPLHELTVDEVNAVWAKSWEHWQADVGLKWPTTIREERTDG